MRVGEYVRNKYGIAKIIDIKTNDEGIDICYFDNDIAFMIDRETGEEKFRCHVLPLGDNVDINKIRHSRNIIDLLGIGDVIRFEIETPMETSGILKGITNITDEEMLKNIKKDNQYHIKSVITHEQIEQMEYKI